MEPAMQSGVVGVGVLPSSRTWRWAILIVLAMMAVLSTFIAVKEAVLRGYDFQWSGAHLLAQHQDEGALYASESNSNQSPEQPREHCKGKRSVASARTRRWHYSAVFEIEYL
jgi:hypothetical protein